MPQEMFNFGPLHVLKTVSEIDADRFLSAAFVDVTGLGPVRHGSCG